MGSTQSNQSQKKTYQGIVLMYNYCLRTTFEKLVAWLQHIHQHCQPDCVVTLVEHKYVHSNMTEEREVSVEEGREYANRNGLVFTDAGDVEDNSLVVDKMFDNLLEEVHCLWKPKAVDTNQYNRLNLLIKINVIYYD